jgi:hypothetical protein
MAVHPKSSASPHAILDPGGKREDPYSSKFFKQAFENFLARFFGGLPQIFDRRC